MNEREQGIAVLSAARSRVALALTAVMLVVYFSFILLIAFDKPLAGSLVGGIRGLSVGILSGILMIFVAWALTFVYVQWANRNYDSAMKELGG